MVDILTETGLAIINPLQSIWLKVVEFIPHVIGAIIVIVIGYFIAVILGHVVKVILEKIGLNRWIQKARLTKAVGHTDVPALCGTILKWYIIVIFLQAAASVARLGALSDFLMKFALWLPNLIVAVIIFLVGLAGIHYLEIKIKEHTKMKWTRGAAKVLSVVLLIILALVALRQIGINVTLAERVFLIVIGGFVFAIALAFGVGLGFGMKDESKNIIKLVKQGFHK